MLKFEVIANDTSYGHYLAEDKEGALIAHVIDAGYKSIEAAAETVGQTEAEFRSTFRIVEAEAWFVFASHSRETQYGFGYGYEAERYCDMIDTDEHVYHFWALTDDQADEQRLDSGSEGFNLDDAITELKEILANEAA